VHHRQRYHGNIHAGRTGTAIHGNVHVVGARSIRLEGCVGAAIVPEVASTGGGGVQGGLFVCAYALITSKVDHGQLVVAYNDGGRGATAVAAYQNGVAAWGNHSKGGIGASVLPEVGGPPG